MSSHPTIPDALKRLIPYIKLDANGNLFITDIAGNTVMEVGANSPAAPYNSSGLPYAASFQDVEIYPPGMAHPGQILPLTLKSFGFGRIVGNANNGSATATATITLATAAQLAVLSFGSNFHIGGFVTTASGTTGTVTVTDSYDTEGATQPITNTLVTTSGVQHLQFYDDFHVVATPGDPIIVTATVSGTVTYYFNCWLVQMSGV